MIQRVIIRIEGAKNQLVTRQPVVDVSKINIKTRYSTQLILKTKVMKTYGKMCGRL